MKVSSLLRVPAALTLAIASTGSPLRAALCDGISTAPASPLTTVRVAGAYLRPLLVAAPPGDTHRIFIVEQDGTIRIVKDGVALATPFLNVSSLTRSPADGGNDEQGLLGLAFHPSYATNGLFYIFHTDSAGANNLVVRYARDAGNPDLADTSTRQVIATIPHSSFGNHNGGNLAFAPDDGMMYVGTGDGGNFCDSLNNAQNPTSLSGKMLRLDVDATPITVQIWALGLRNPWRYCFDRLNSDLYIADVGQNEWEEIDYRPAPRSSGDNFGWDVYEGSHCPNPSCSPTPACNTVTNPIMPISEYQHPAGCSITGGYVYRGCRMPDLAGRYFYGDYCAAFIKSFRVVSGTVTDPLDHTTELGGAGVKVNSLTSFGEDARGEIYVVDRDGEVYQIVPILQNLQVSGVGAAPFLPGDTDWGWENLQLTSGHPITQYRVYRAAGNGSGVFDCVFQSSANLWPGGDPATPAVGELFSYVVTAVNASGNQTSPGTGTGGTPRTLSSLVCPL